MYEYTLPSAVVHKYLVPLCLRD